MNCRLSLPQRQLPYCSPCSPRQIPTRGTELVFVCVFMWTWSCDLSLAVKTFTMFCARNFNNIGYCDRKILVKIQKLSSFPLTLIDTHFYIAMHDSMVLSFMAICTLFNEICSRFVLFFCWKCSINFSLTFFEVSRTGDAHKLLTYCKWSTPGKYGRIYFTMILVIEKLMINARAMSLRTSLLPIVDTTGDPLTNLAWLCAMCPNRN